MKPEPTSALRRPAAPDSIVRATRRRAWDEVSGMIYDRFPWARQKRGEARYSRSVQKALELAAVLVTDLGEIGGAGKAVRFAELYRGMTETEALALVRAISRGFVADPAALMEAAKAYVAAPDTRTASVLARIAEPSRQRLLRRLSMAPGGAFLLVELRARVLAWLKDEAELEPLAMDLQHVLTSWFSPGFLELRRLDWTTPAAVLEKLIRYEAVHEIQGWDDLRRRLADDRRCYGFFHPLMPDEPLIFTEVALTQEMSSEISGVLAPAAGAARRPSTAIFYSISNCQEGLRNIAFGNLLIKQIVGRLGEELPSIKTFATLSPIPGFRRWLGQADGGRAHAPAELLAALEEPEWWLAPARAEALRAPLMQLCATYLTRNRLKSGAGQRMDSVSHFHLSNGARLERLNWLADLSPKGVAQSFGLMANYRYLPSSIERNHEAYERDGVVARSNGVAALLRPAKARRLRAA